MCLDHLKGESGAMLDASSASMKTAWPIQGLLPALHMSPLQGSAVWQRGDNRQSRVHWMSWLQLSNQWNVMQIAAFTAGNRSTVDTKNSGSTDC